jgi:hypothetical protein
MAEAYQNQWSKVLAVSAEPTPGEVCEAFERFAAKTLAPRELGRWPLYCVAAGDLPAEVRSAFEDSLMGVVGGFCSQLSYFWLREHLQVDRGPGPLLVVVDKSNGPQVSDAILQEVQERREEQGRPLGMQDIKEFLDELRAPYVPAVLVHELAHAIDHIESGWFDEWAEPLASCSAGERAARRVMSRQMETLGSDSKHRSESGEVDPGHGPRFVRTLVHLDYRLEELGINAEGLVPSHNYGHRPYGECRAALKDEAASLAGRSITEILPLALPPAFAACVSASGFAT